jgi:sulfur transfer protein SufE
LEKELLAEKNDEIIKKMLSNVSKKSKYESLLELIKELEALEVKSIDSSDS